MAAHNPQFEKGKMMKKKGTPSKTRGARKTAPKARASKFKAGSIWANPKSAFFPFQVRITSVRGGEVYGEYIKGMFSGRDKWDAGTGFWMKERGGQMLEREIKAAPGAKRPVAPKGRRAPK